MRVTCIVPQLQANFLKEEERVWLHQRNADLKAKAVGSGAATHGWDSLKNYRTWHLAAISMVANIPKCERIMVFLRLSLNMCVCMANLPPFVAPEPIVLIVCVLIVVLCALCRWNNLLVSPDHRFYPW